MRNVEPVIEEGGSVEDVHHLRAHGAAARSGAEEGEQGSGVGAGHRPQDGGLVHDDGKAVLAGEGGVGAGATVGAGSAAVRQRERNDALEGRIEELEEKTRSGHRGSVRPVSRRCRRRCCASGIALATRPQKSVEWF